MAAFGSVEHVKSLSRRKLENLFRYVLKSRDELQEIITQQSGEITELRRRVARQAKQLKAVQMALEKRNRTLDGYRELVHDLQNADGWPDDDKLMDYGIDPKEVK